MNYLRYFFLFFILIVPLASIAQYEPRTHDISLGEKLNVSKRSGLHQIVGANESGLYIMQTQMKKSFASGAKNSLVYLLQNFDREMKKVQEAELDLMHNGEHLTYKFITMIKGRMFVFLGNTRQDTDTETLFAREINAHSLEPVGKLKKIAEFNHQGRKGYFVHALSDDQSKLLITYVHKAAGDNRQAIDLYVLDNQLNLLWSKAQNFPYPEQLFTTEQYKVDPKGGVYLLSTLYDDNRNHKRRGNPDYRYHLISYRNGGKEVNQYSIKLPGKFLTDMKIVINEQQDIIGGGFYAEQGSFHIKGSYFFTIGGKSQEVVSNSVKQFNPNFLDQERPEVHANTKERGQLKNMGISLNDIVLREDGSTVLVGEQYFVSANTRLKRRLFGKAQTSTNYYYDYKDIILVNTNAQGKIEWTEKVGKHQHSHNDAGRYSSFSLSLLQDDLYFVFNVNPEGVRSTSANGKGSCENHAKTRIVKVDRGGNQYNSTIGALSKYNVTLMPGTGYRVAENEQVFLGGGKKNNRLIRVKFLDLKELTALIQ